MNLDLEAAVAKLNKMGVPTDSPTRAASYINDNLPTPERAQKMIADLTTSTVDVTEGTDPRVVQYTAAYVVNGIVKANVMNVTPMTADLIVEARTKAHDFLKRLAWTFAGQEDTKAEIENADPETVKAGNAKKGARKVLALRVYNERIKDHELTRKEAIAILVEEVGLTPAGASTYYSNFKSGKWA